MKTYAIELQRIQSMSNAHGLVNARVEVAVQAQARRADDEAPGSVLTMSVNDARTLFLLLKAQLAEIDAKKGRSQR